MFQVEQLLCYILQLDIIRILSAEPFKPGFIEMTSVCEHKEQIGCALTALPRCCSCVDKRPLATAYPIYIDGKGMKLQGKRWQRYCWKCRGRREYLLLHLFAFFCSITLEVARSHNY